MWWSTSCTPRIRHPPGPARPTRCTTERREPPVHRRVRRIPPGANLVARPPAGHPGALHLGAPAPVPPPSPGSGAPTAGGKPSGNSARAAPCARVLAASPTHLYRAAPVPRPPLPALSRHTFLRNQEVTAVRGVNLVPLLPAAANDPPWPRALSPAPDWGLWRNAWGEWPARLPRRCR